MSTIWIQKFRDGLDARRLPETTNSSALIHAVDGHITRGGEFEKRAAFVPTYTLPAGETVSLAATADSIYVFGHAAEPAGMPADVTYQRLDIGGGAALDRVVSWDLFDGEIYAVGAFGDDVTYHFYGTTIALSRAGTAAWTQLSLTQGSPGDTIDILVDGVSATGGPVAWATSDTATRTAVVNAINTTISTPDYISNPVGFFALRITALELGATANGRLVTIITTGGLIVSLPIPLLSGGVDFYLSGTRYVRTIGTKEYTLSGPDLQFSSVGDPLDWAGDFGGTGFGFIDTSSYTSGSEDLTAVVEFRDAGAVFSQRTIQIWDLRPDPADNALRQRLRNTGTSCPKSITQFGDGDIFYLDEPGLRSLRSRGSSTAATSYGVGVKVDPLIVAKLRSLTEAERALVVGLIEPVTGNFWLIVKDTIYVYAFFPEEGVSAWTTYSTHHFDHGVRVDFNVDDAVVFNRRVYLRSGDTIYVYGGLATGQETDDTQAELWTAYQDGENPAESKTWRAFDAAVSGEWAVAVGMSLADAAVEDDVAIIDRTTYNDERIGVIGQSTHAGLRFRSRGDGPAVVGACALHYEADGGGGHGAAASAWATEAAAADAWMAYPDGGDLATARVWHRRG